MDREPPFADEPPEYWDEDFAMALNLQLNDSGSEPDEPPILTSLPDLMTLPADITSQIFRHACQPIVAGYSWYRQMSPLTLGAVCQQWRAYVWATSELWSTLVIRIRKGPGLLDHIDLLKQWIERSKTRPLDILLEIENAKAMSKAEYDELTRKHRIKYFLQILVQHSEQWRRVEFKNLPNLWFDILHALMEDKRAEHSLEPTDSEQSARTARTAAPRAPMFPNLKHVTIEAIYWTTGSARGPRQETCPRRLDFSPFDAPNLRGVELISLARDWMNNIIIPKQQLISLDCSDMVVDMKAVLEKYPNILSASFNGVTLGQRVERRALTHPKLRRLQVSFSHWRHGQNILNGLSVPTIRELYITLTFKLTEHSTLRFDQFFLECCQSLTVFTLECSLPTDDVLIDILSMLPTLVEVNIRDLTYHNIDVNRDPTQYPALSGTFFDALHPDGDASYLPKLQVLTYEGLLAVHAIDFLEPLLIRSRVRSGMARGNEEQDSIAPFRLLAIMADQVSATCEFSIAEYSDPQYIWEVIQMTEMGMLSLRNVDGSAWL